ncbi:23S rRNA (uridine(2552)-2'-O)-methyltransferase [hydrothermal vent metagenome]|uniref:23S rRNA (Uridine(2552)-2'-O)-methyltransferase n=1 Tax=hydrothermal vent metagenome TaxID=652676 RepID=A0A3B1AUN3_9ZZZZ
MKRSKSSQNWLKRHFDDPYVKQAQKAGYRSRAVFKLLEIQEKKRIIKPGQVIVDLGAAPGGWAQAAVPLVGKKGAIIAVDILPIEPIEGVVFIQGDFAEQDVHEQLLLAINGRNIDLVMSDMAPNISGLKAVDQPRAMCLAELALDFARGALKPGGDFLVKVFQGEGFDGYLKDVRKTFKKVVIRKPKASRPKSREVYLLAMDMKKEAGA